MAFDTFMYFEGGTPAVAGESTDDVYSKKKAFEIYSFSWGMSNPVTIGSASSGAGAGKVSISSFNIMKKLDSATHSLMTLCQTGGHMPKATVILRKAGGTKLEYLKFEFEELFVESIQHSGSSGGDDTPTESVSFAFKKYTMSYTPQGKDGKADPSGAKTVSWDQTTNKA